MLTVKDANRIMDKIEKESVWVLGDRVISISKVLDILDQELSKRKEKRDVNSNL